MSEDAPRKQQVMANILVFFYLSQYLLPHHFVYFLTGCVRPISVAELSLTPRDQMVPCSENTVIMISLLLGEMIGCLEFPSKCSSLSFQKMCVRR